MSKVTIYTDGACSGNPGPGGWAAVLTSGGHKKEISGSNPDTTNNQMELQAVLSAIYALRRPCCDVVIVTGSVEASPSDTPSCHFLRGILAKIFEERTGKDVYCHERKCLSKGDEKCEFVIDLEVL